MISSHALEVTIGDLTLHPVEASITLDESWAPFAQATLRCPVIDRAQIAAIDPRDRRRGTIKVKQEFGRLDTVADLSRRWAGMTVRQVAQRDLGITIHNASDGMYHHWDEPGTPYVEPYVRLFDLALRSREIDPATGEVTLTLASDEALIQDNAHVATGPGYPPSTSLLQVVYWILQRENLGVNFWDSSAETARVDIEKNPLQPGQSAWEYVAGVVQQLGYRLWCDERRRWSLRVDQPSTGYAVTLSTTENITAARDRLTVDRNYYRAVVVTYRWTDAEGKQQTAYDSAYMPPTGRHVFTVSYDRPYPGPGAAKRILSTLLKRAHEVPVTAVSDYGVEPGATATVQITSTPPLTGPVSAVTWRWPADEMDVTTRELVAGQGEPITEYTPVPDPEEAP